MITLISTVYNCKEEISQSLEFFLEEKNVGEYDKIIICDGGSNDGTLELLKTFAEKSDKLEIISVPGANISNGRNIAINAASEGIIVAFDSGTIYSSEWLREMIDPLKENEYDIVEGNSILVGYNKFQKILSHLTDNNQEILKQGSSHRCIAYKKLVWEKVGGYPENVQAGEDTWFNSMTRKLNFRIYYSNTAICFWEVRKDLSSYLKMIYRNTKGHISLKDNIGTNKLLITAIINCTLILGLVSSFISTYLLIGTFFLSIFYFSYRLLKPPRYKYFYRLDNFAYGTFVIFMSDFTIAFVFFYRLIKKIYKK
jgi:glycosyltransferase involved in cell wall biosynthesis